MIEYGYLGAAVWAVLFFGSIGRGFFRARDGGLRTSDRLEYAVSVLALVGVALHSLVDFPLQIASIQLYVMLFLAFCWTRPANEPRSDAPPAVFRPPHETPAA